jgi:hypothetical protein
MHDECTGGIANYRSQRDTYQVDKERQMVRAGGGKVCLKWSLEFGVQYGRWQNPAETNDLYIS